MPAAWMSAHALERIFEWDKWGAMPAWPHEAVFRVHLQLCMMELQHAKMMANKLAQTILGIS